MRARRRATRSDTATPLVARSGLGDRIGHQARSDSASTHPLSISGPGSPTFPRIGKTGGNGQLQQSLLFIQRRMPRRWEVFAQSIEQGLQAARDLHAGCTELPDFRDSQGDGANS